MKNMYFVKDSEVAMEYLETGEGNHVNLQDVFGKKEGAPFTFGMYEMMSSKGVEFEYDGDGAVCICIEGSMTLKDEKDGIEHPFDKGDIVFIPQEKGKKIIWNSKGYAKMAYVTYPYWR